MCNSCDIFACLTMHLASTSDSLPCLQGVAVGTAIPISVVNAGGSLTASTNVDVVDTFVCLTKISLVAYTGATWLSPPASISPVASVTAQLQALQVRLLGQAVYSCTAASKLSR